VGWVGLASWDGFRLNERVKLSDVFPPSGHVQRLYCNDCRGPLDLTFTNFHEDVSGVDINIAGLPVLRCAGCRKDYLPDNSRFAIIELHKRAIEKGMSSVTKTRCKLANEFGFTKIQFLYDADDYYYIPGLKRPFDIGFLTPVFFKKEVVLKYDTSPTCCVKFASPTYGTIEGETFSIPFGINKNGKVVMWLGDIATLPEPEQYHLRSENVESDHSIGSEFYDGQIECIFTEPPAESKLFNLRSEFVDACRRKFGIKIAHLDNEVIDIASSFNAPVVDSEKERRYVADTLNKIYVESFDSSALGTVISKAGGNPKNLGTLKRLQLALQSVGGTADVPKLLSPFFTLYDLRVAFLHLTSAEKAKAILESVTNRLAIAEGSGLLVIYERLLKEMVNSFEKMTELVKT
jgi:hypothetical protein